MGKLLSSLSYKPLCHANLGNFITANPGALLYCRYGDFELVASADPAASTGGESRNGCIGGLFRSH